MRIENLKKKITKFWIGILFIFIIYNLIILNRRTSPIYRNRYKSMHKSYPNPIDIVYTWVNGSDIELMKQLQFYKTNMFLENQINDGVKLKKQFCSFEHCAYADHILISSSSSSSSSVAASVPPNLTVIGERISQMLNNKHPCRLQRIDTVERSEVSRRSGELVQCSVSLEKLFQNGSEVTVEIEPFWRGDNSIILSQVFIAAVSEQFGKLVPSCFILSGFPELRDVIGEEKWKRSIQEKFSQNITVIKSSLNSFLVNFSYPSSDNGIDVCQQNNLTSIFRDLQCHKAVFIVDSYLSSILHDISVNRYQDNDELKYSLRSLDKFADFEFRYIFLVTNGQVPDWLNVDHPRIKIIHHNMIFTNQSNLPTFNSAAIEANLHNIPDISDHFIYLNDDVFFGKPVHIEDFYRLDSGYQVYLGWDVPSCIEGCPNSWLGDGYCDRDCNVEECTWDGGDCKKNPVEHNIHSLIGADPTNQNYSESLRLLLSGHHNNNNDGSSSSSSSSCSCNRLWLADRYCDEACNNIKCGYDMGDCGDEHLIITTHKDGSSSNSFYVNLDDDSLHSHHHIQHAPTVYVPRKTEFFSIKLGPSKLIQSQQQEEAGTNIKSVQLSDTNLVFASSYAVKYARLIILLDHHQQNLKQTADQELTVNVTLKDDISKNFKIIIYQSNNSNDKVYTNITPPKLPSRTDLVTPSNVAYQTPRTVLMASERNDGILKGNNNNVEELEWRYPIEMSRYRLLLRDGLVSLKGYGRLVNRLSSGQQQRHSHVSNQSSSSSSSSLPVLVHLTAFEKDAQLLHELDWGFLPWEKRLKMSSHRSSRQARPSITATTTTTTTTITRSVTGRKLMDLYSDSLRFSNRMLSKYYNNLQKKVPAHGPHFISRNILKAARTKFSQEWDQTTAHRFRSSMDVQFAFAYFYFLTTENRSVGLNEYLGKFDTDNSSTLNQNELRTLAVSINVNETVTDKQFSEFLTQINSDCKNNNSNATLNKIQISLDKFQTCFNWSNVVNLPITQPRYTHEIKEDPDLEFIMISNNRDKVLKKLDGVRHNPKKFFCLNDNLPNSENANSENRIRADVREFLDYYFPFPSQYEITEENKNKLHQYKLQQQHHHYGLLRLVMVVVLILLAIRIGCHCVHVFHIRMRPPVSQIIYRSDCLHISP